MATSRSWTVWAGFFIAVLLATWGAAQSPVPSRVALLATTLNADSEKYLDVATAELTARGGIELVERQAIRAVLGEQSLALQQDASGVAAGKLLRADVVGVLETTPDGKEAGGFAVLDTATGVSYWNEGIAQTDIEAVAGEMMRGVAAALEKRSRAGALGTVCMLGARNAEFPRNMDVFCETVAYLLDRRLVANPALATLDRRRLEAVVSENALPGGASKSAALLASLRLVELDFRRGAADDEVKVLARVTDAGGALTAQPEVVGPMDAAELADRLQAALAEGLHAAPQAAAGNRAQEANRFRTQGEILWERGLATAAIQALDAAYALDPGRPEQISAHADVLLKQAYVLARTNEFERALDLLRRTLDMEERHQVWHPEAGSQSKDNFVSALAKCKLGIPSGAPLRNEFDDLRRRYQRVLGLTVNPAETSRIAVPLHSINGFDGVPAYYPADCSEQLQFRASSARVLCLDATEFFGILNARLNEWFRREADLSQPHDAGVINTLHSLCGWGYRYVWDGQGWIPFDDEYVRGMRAVAQRFAEHSRRTVRLEGLYFSLLVDFSLQTRGGPAVAREDFESRAGQIITLALEGVAATNETPAGDVPVLYELAARAAGPSRGTWDARAKKEWEDAQLHNIALAMFDNHHISGTILLMMEYRQVDYERYREPVLWRLKAVRNDRAYRRFNLSRRDLQSLLRVLPETPVAPPAAPDPAPDASADMRVLWQTPAPEDWRNRLAGLHVEHERTLYAYRGYQWHYEATKNPEIEVLRVDLADGRTDVLGKIQVNTCWGEQFYNLRSRCPGDFIEDSACTETHLWLATSGDGLYGLPLQVRGGDPIRVGVADGLPSDFIHSVRPVGGALYVGCGAEGSEGYLVRYDPAVKSCEVIVSTLRASPETPLDSVPNGFHLQKMVYDAPRNRLLLMVNSGQKKESDGQLWEYRLADGCFRRVLALGWPARAVTVGADGTVELYVNRVLTPQYVFYYGVATFDPATDAGHLLFANQNRGAGAGLPIQPETRRYRNLYYRSTALGDGWLFHFGLKQENGKDLVELRRISLATGAVQPVPGQAAVSITRNTMTGQPNNLFYWGWLRWLPQSRVLLIGNGGQFTAVQVGS